MFNYITEKIQNFRNQRQFTAQNCLNRQAELKQREERRQIEENKRRLEAVIDEIENKIHFVVSQSYNQQNIMFQVNDGEKEMFEKVKSHFISKGFKAFFQELDGLPGVEALIISWM